MPTLLIWSHASLFLHFNFVLSCSIYCQGIHNGAVHNLLHHWEGSCQYQGSQYWENLQHNQMSAWLKALTTTLCVGVNSCWLWLKLLQNSEEAVQDILYVWLQLVHGLLNNATTTKLRPPVDRSVYVMTHGALTTPLDWILAEIQHRPVLAQYHQFGRIFGHGLTLRPKIEFQVWKLFLVIASSNVSNFNRD